MGMEVNLGTSDNGSGDDQPMSVDDPSEAVAINSRQTVTRADDALRDMERTDDNDAPEVPPTRPVRTTGVTPRQVAPRTVRSTPVAEHTTASTAPVRQEQRPRFIYPGSTGRGGNGAQASAGGTSEGNTTGSGDRGVPHGTPGATNYTGSPGPGTGGISHTISGRSIVAFPPKEAEFREGGRVVVRVTVNRDGAIVSRQVVSSSNAELRRIALDKVSKVKFNRSDDSPAEQFGNITFVFKTRS
jgi:TonB family protein